MSLQNMSSESIASINMKNIQAFAETFLANPNKHVEWLVDSGNRSRFSRASFLLIVLLALLAPTEGMAIFAATFCSAISGSFCHSCNNYVFTYFVLLRMLLFVDYNCNVCYDNQVDQLLCFVLLFPVLDKQVNLCQACLPALKNEWCHIQLKDDCVGDEVFPIYFTILCCNVG